LQALKGFRKQMTDLYICVKCLPNPINACKIGPPEPFLLSIVCPGSLCRRVASAPQPFVALAALELTDSRYGGDGDKPRCIREHGQRRKHGDLN
jgi:hypothetical protein